MGDQNKSLIDQAKDALGMGDDDEHEHADHGDRRPPGADTRRNEGWGSDTTARTTGTGGTTDSDESILRDEDTVDSTRRETGV